MAQKAHSEPRSTKPDACETAKVLLEAPDCTKGLTTHRTLSEPGECDACDDGWALLEEDALSDGHCSSCPLSSHR